MVIRMRLNARVRHRDGMVGYGRNDGREGEEGR